MREQPPGGQPEKNVLWVIDGETEQENPTSVQIRIGSEALAMIVGERAIHAKTRADLYDAVDAKTVGGVLPALDAWRRMIGDGPKRFGETYYLGTMPLAGERPLRDCMVGIDGEMEVRWLYHPQSSLVEVVEVFADRDSDPAELWISREAGKQTPTMLELRYGLDSYLKIRVKSWKIQPAEDRPPPADNKEEKA